MGRSMVYQSSHEHFPGELDPSLQHAPSGMGNGPNAANSAVTLGGTRTGIGRGNGDRHFYSSTSSNNSFLALGGVCTPCSTFQGSE